MLADTPVRTGYVEGGVAATRLRGPEAWLEAGVHPLKGVGLFGRAFANPDDAGAMVGARWEFDL